MLNAQNQFPCKKKTEGHNCYFIRNLHILLIIYVQKTKKGVFRLDAGVNNNFSHLTPFIP